MKFREFETSSAKFVLAGKDAASNEELINKEVEKDETVLHTGAPGSPFVNIKGKATLKDIKEAAVFCALKSQDWRNNKKDVVVHIFTGADIYKRKDMKLGTFGVKKFKAIKVKKQDIEKLEKKLK
jgi:predicted ribosome quality control (RQC) complex YloA/Tae2 family protein